MKGGGNAHERQCLTRKQPELAAAAGRRRRVRLRLELRQPEVLPGHLEHLTGTQRTFKGCAGGLVGFF